MAQVKRKSFVQKNGLIAVWSMAGFMAMGYIGFLATGTDSKHSDGALIAKNGVSSQQPSVSPVQQEMAALRAHVQELTNREEKLARKLSNIEEALGPNTAALPDQTTGYGIDESAPVQAKSSAKVSINVLPLTQEDNITEFSKNDQSENYGLDLASARSVDSLKRHWNYLKKTRSGLLENMKPHFIDKGTSELPLFSLIVGPFDRMSDAREHCVKFTSVNIDCQETSFQVKSMGKIHTAGRAISK